MTEAGGSLDVVSGAGKAVFEVEGDAFDALQVMSRIANNGGKVIDAPGYPGIMMELPNGGRVGLRLISGSGEPTIDLNIPGLPMREMKFVG